MKNWSRLILISVFALSIIYLGGCTSAPPQKTYQPPLSQFQQQLTQGKYQQVLDSYKAAYDAHPESQLLRDNYLETIEKIKALADDAFQKKNFTRAEKIYLILIENFPNFKKTEKPLSFSPQSLKEVIKKIRINRSKTQAEQYLSKGQFQKAIDVYTTSLKNYPGNSLLLSPLKTALEKIKKTAIKAFSNSEFAAAGRSFYVLAKNYPKLQNFYKPLSLSPQFLEEKITICRLELTKKGLELYRKGKLAEAISVWNDILAFDPDNTEIKKAVATAQAQLKKIKKQ